MSHRKTDAWREREAALKAAEALAPVNLSSREGVAIANALYSIPPGGRAVIHGHTVERANVYDIAFFRVVSPWCGRSLSRPGPAGPVTRRLLLAMVLEGWGATGTASGS